MQGEKQLEVESRTVGPSSTARSKFRRVCACVAVPLTLVAIFGVVTFISLWCDFPQAHPVRLHLDASQDSRYVRALFEVEINYKWGAFHTYQMNDAECQIRVACNDSDPCVALTSRLTGVNRKGDRLSYDFQFNDVSPRNLMRVMSGSHGTTLRCDIEPSIDVWNTGMVMARTWTYETTSLLGASPLTLVRTAHHETMPTRDNLTASLDANYTLHWALPEGMIANFLKSTPVTIKADAGVVESSKRAAMGFVGVDDRVVVKALPDGGVEATLPLMTTSSINIAATAGVLGTAAFNFTDSIDALNSGDVPQKEAEVFFHIHGKAVQDLLGKEHRIAVHSTHVRLDSPANSGGRRLNPQDDSNPPPPPPPPPRFSRPEPWQPTHHRPNDADSNAFFQTHRLSVNDDELLGIDIAVVDGTSANGPSAPFEVQVDVFQIFAINESQTWNLKAALVVDGDQVDCGFRFTEEHEEKMKGVVYANFDNGDFMANWRNDQDAIFEAHHDAEAKRLRVVFEDGENLEFETHANWGDDEPERYHLSLTSPDLNVTSDLDAQRERLRVDVKSPDLEMSYSVDHQAKRMELRLDSADIDVSFNVDSYESGLDSQGHIEFCEESASETSSGRCPCIGLPPTTERVSCTSNYWNGLDPWWSTGECVLGSRHVHDQNAIYPGDYGATCKKHYEPSSYDCFDVDAGKERPTVQRGERADWCGRSWCYVDANNCHGADYYESSYFRGSGLYYSYRECWSDQSACPCSGLPSSIDQVPCSADGEDKPWYLHSDSAEDCVRVPELPGEPLYPGDYGATCKEHREPGHPDCWDVTTNSELPHQIARSEHCDRSWCFVDPNNCRGDKSHDIHEVWDFHDEVGVLARIYDWESDECRCIGGLPPSDSIVRVACSEEGRDTPWYLEGAADCVMKHGRRFRGDYGARMEKQYSVTDGGCFWHWGDQEGQERPHREPQRQEWCDQAWCYVDQENCEGVDVHESHYFPGENLYYSYRACEPEEHSGIHQPGDRPGLHRQESDGTSCGVTSVNFGAEWSFDNLQLGDDWENVPQKYASDYKGWSLGLNNGTGDNEQELVITYTAPVTISLLAMANGNDNVAPAPEQNCANTANNEDCCTTHEDCTFTDCSREGWGSPGCYDGTCYFGREEAACEGAENGFQLDEIDGRPSWCWDGIASMRCSPEPVWFRDYGTGIDETIAAANGWEQESEWTHVRYESGERKEMIKVKAYVQKFTTGSSVSMTLPGSGTNPVHLGVFWNGKHCQAKGPVQSTTTTPQETTTTRTAEQGNCTEGKSLRRFEIHTAGNFGDADNNGQWSAQVTTQDPMYQEDVSRIDLTWTREGASDPNMDRFSLELAVQEELSREESERTPSNGTYHAAMNYSVEIVVRTTENAEAKSTIVMVDLGAHPTCSQPGGATDNKRCSWLREEDGDSWSEDMTCCRYSLPHGLNLFGFDEREELANNEVRVVEFLQEDHVRVEAYLDRSKDLPRLEADYTFVGDVHRIEGFVNVSATEALASGNIQWRTSDDMFESSAIIWDGEMSELVAGDLSWHERPRDFHVVNGSLAIGGEPLGSGQIVVDDSRPHFKAFSERVLNGDGEELSFGGISWSEHAHEQTVAGNLSMDGDLLGTATVIVDDHPNVKDLWASVTGGEAGAEPLLDMTCKLEPGDDLFSFTADIATNISDPKLSIVVGVTTLDPQPAIDVEIRDGENFESLVLAGHAHCTHPGRLLETGDNRQVLLAEPFLASGWLDNRQEDEETKEDVRARIGAFDWKATDEYGNFSSRLRVTGADDDTEMLLWTLSIGEHPRDAAQDLWAQNGQRRLTDSDDVMVILSRLAIEEDDKLRLRGMLEQDTGLMEGEIEALVDGESHSVWCEASQGFLEMMDRPTGFDRFHVALGSVIEGNQANVSVYIERGPDVQVSGLGYRVGLYDGAGENKTVIYEGSGDIDLAPGRAPRRPEIRSETAVRVVMEMGNGDFSLFSRRSFEDLMVQALRDNEQQVNEADVIVESITAEVKTKYTVDEWVELEDMQTSVVNMNKVRREDVTVQPAGQQAETESYEVTVVTKDLRRAAEIWGRLGDLVVRGPPEVRPVADFVVETQDAHGCLKTTTTLPGPPLGSDPFTVIMEHTPAQYSGRREWLLTMGQSSTGANHWLWSGGSSIQFGAWGGGQVTNGDISGASIIAQVYTGSQVHLYLDGQLVGGPQGSTINILTNELKIGSNDAASENDYSGCIHKTMFFRRALAHDEVAVFKQAQAVVQWEETVALVSVRTTVFSEAEVAPLPPPLAVVSGAAAAVVGEGEITIREVEEVFADPPRAPLPATTTTMSVTCAPLELGEGVDVSACADKEHTETCQVRCAEGYSGQELTYTCRNTGVFDGIPMSCARVMCPESSLPVGTGRVFRGCSERYAGQTCTVQCDSGFAPATGPATATLTCSMEGEFAGNPPQCEPTPCEASALDDDASLEHDCTGVTNNQMCLVWCADGYTADTPPVVVVRTCNGRTLAGGTPTCTADAPQRCNRGLPSGRGIDSDCQGKETEETCNARCVDGFEPDSSACTNGEFTCMPDRAFDSSCTSGEFACVRSQCQDLATVANFGANAGVETTCASRFYQESCLAYCAAGYTGAARPVRCTLGSPSTAGFEQLGGGAASAPTCTARECIFNLPNIRGVQHTCAGKTTGQTCEVTVADGFEYVGTSTAVTLTCGTDRAFTGGPLPDVQPQTCPRPALLGESQFGTTCGASTPVGERCYAYCLAGTSVTTYTCEMVSGTATLVPSDGIEVSCARRLSSAEANRTATQRRLQECDSSISSTSGLSGDGVLNDCQGIAVNDPCISYCANGYSEDAGPFRYTCESGGALTLSGTETSSCTALQCTYGMPTGVGVAHDCGTAVTDASCTASCDAGYQYASGSSAQTFTCQATGELSGTSPMCEPAECAPPTLAQEFRSTCTGKVTGEECLVDCADGWELDSAPAVWTCGTDGQVTGTDPTCTAQNCSAVGLPAGDAFDVSEGCSSLTTGQTCSIGCAAGYSGQAETFTCDPSGTITGSAPTCAEPTCPVPNAAATVAFVGCDGLVSGQTCFAACAEGYQLANGAAPEEWTCDSQTLDLTGNAPQCEALPCDDGLPVGDAFTHDCSEVVTGETCSCSCADGYVVTGSEPQQQELQCLGSGGGWLSGSCPPCERARCTSQSRQLENVVNGCDGVAQGGECWASCAQGYDGEDQLWTCELQDDGTVSLQGQAPSCTLGSTSIATTTGSTTTEGIRGPEVPDACPRCSVPSLALMAASWWLALVTAGATLNA